MDYRLDEVDKRILYYLAADARNTSAPSIAEEVDVSAGTIRNRIRQLEANGIVQGYHAAIDYERADDLLTSLFTCNASVSEREALGRRALDVRGVVNVREVMTGRGNLRVKAVGRNTDDIARISRELADLGLDIEDEDLLQREYFRPYHQFGPDDADRRSLVDFMSLAGSAEVVDVPVAETAPLAGKSLAEANEEGVLDDDVLVVAVERDDDVLMPKGSTRIHAGDLVTLFSRNGIPGDVMGVFARRDDEE